MESNIKIKDTPKLNISSAVFGDKDSAGDSTGSIRNIHKTISKLSGHVRKSLVRIKSLEEKFSKVESKIDVDEERFSKLEKKISVNSEKITRIKKILQTQKGNVGKKLPGGSNVNQSLVETNKILVEIQKQITTAFGMRNEEEKEKNKTLKKEKSKEKLRLKEGAIESVRKIGGAIKKTAQFITAPFGGFFDKILEFITLLGLGIGANAVFKWFQDEENRDKMSKFFNIIVSNWKLIRNILGAMVIAGLALKIIGLATSIGGVIAFLANPVTLTVLATLVGLAAGAYFASKGAKWAINKFQETQYGKGNSKKGIFATKLGDEFGRISKKEDLEKLTPEERADATKISLYDNLLKSRQNTNDALYRARNNTSPDSNTIKQLESELKFKDKSIADAENQTMIKGKSLGDLFDMYSSTGLLPKTSLSERKMGGPVTAKTPYLVGESGPEIFAPNVDGSIVNNMRTEKIYQMISSKDAGKINFMTMELPPKDMKKKQSDSTQQTESPVPSISPVNGSNPYMNTTPEIYGIYV
jgi:hypothetical protein